MLHCKDCDRFGTDPVCDTKNKEDNACCGFTDTDNELFQVLAHMLKYGKYSRRHIEILCIEFEQSDIYKCIKEDIDNGT